MPQNMQGFHYTITAYMNKKKNVITITVTPLTFLDIKYLIH